MLSSALPVFCTHSDGKVDRPTLLIPDGRFGNPRSGIVS